VEKTGRGPGRRAGRDRPFSLPADLGAGRPGLRPRYS